VEKIVIEKEILYIRNYVALQQERKEDNLEVVVDIPDDVRGFTIAPLLLITFVENAFKYVSGYEDRENKVIISLYREDDEVLFRAFNTVDEGMVRVEREKGGIGIANARRRLDLQYPNRHELEITNGGETYEVNLRLNIKSHVVESRYSR
jgi:LytS/YehU family sensor histidine kinase